MWLARRYKTTTVGLDWHDRNSFEDKGLIRWTTDANVAGSRLGCIQLVTAAAE